MKNKNWTPKCKKCYDVGTYRVGCSSGGGVDHDIRTLVWCNCKTADDKKKQGLKMQDCQG